MFQFRQKNEEKYASQKYVKDTLHRSVPPLQSIDEEQQTDINLNDSFESVPNGSNISQQNVTTYKRAYQNYNPQSHASSDGTSSNKKTDLSNENEQNDHEEQIDTIQLDDDRRRPQSASLTKPKKPLKKPQSPLGPPPSSHKQKHRVETMQLNDDDMEQNFNNISDNENEQQQQQIEMIPSSNKTKPPSTQDENNNNNPNNKSRKIRQLQHKLSRQEEETKKKFDELQSKQSRLENAIKLLVKQTSTYKKRQQPTNGQVEGNS